MILYDETPDAYHSNVALGSGDIKAFIRSPMLFKDMQDGLENRETAAMKFGTTAHLAMLEPARFESLVVIKPEGMSFVSKEGKAWRDQQAGKVIVPYADSERLMRMRARMPQEIATMLGRAKCEVTVRTPMDGVEIQCRVDAWDEQRNVKYDLKTIAATESVERDIFKRGYHIQDRWYSLVVRTETGKVPASRLVFVETNPPYRWRIVQLDADYNLMADAEIDRAWNGIQERRKSGDWSDPDELHLLASPPAWAMEDEDEEGDAA